MLGKKPSSLNIDLALCRITGLKIRDKPGDVLLVRYIDETRLPQVTFSFSRLFCQNVIRIGLVPDNLS